MTSTCGRIDSALIVAQPVSIVVVHITLRQPGYPHPPCTCALFSAISIILRFDSSPECIPMNHAEKILSLSAINQCLYCACVLVRAGESERQVVCSYSFLPTSSRKNVASSSSVSRTSYPVLPKCSCVLRRLIVSRSFGKFLRLMGLVRALRFVQARMAPNKWPSVFLGTHSTDFQGERKSDRPADGGNRRGWNAGTQGRRRTGEQRMRY